MMHPLMKICFLTILLLITYEGFAQKNMAPVRQTNFLQMSLPLESRQDKRFFSTTSAKVLLEMETKKAGIGITNVEVYYLQVESVSSYNSDSLVASLTRSNCQLAGVEGDDKFAWVQWNGGTYMIFFSMDKKETNFYIGQCNGTPSFFTDAVSGTTEPVTPPATEYVKDQNIQTTTSPTNTTGSTSTLTKSDYQFTNSQFDDGWTATIQNDWVLLQKNNQSVYLYYAVTYNSDWFSGTGVMERDYYWDNYVAKQFRVEQKQYKDDGEFVSSLKPKYVEGWGIDPQTGERRLLAMTLSISPNAAQLTVAAYSDEQTFRSQFPKANDKYTSDLTNMHRYNKFAIGTVDVTGTWQSGGSQMTQWYDARTGNYAGATFASSSATFSFMDNGTYSSIHNGATGAVGAMNSFQQEYKGKYSISNWTIKASNRYQGRTDSFDAHFQAVRAGRLLYLNDQRGGSYLLVKIK